MGGAPIVAEVVERTPRRFLRSRVGSWRFRLLAPGGHWLLPIPALDRANTEAAFVAAPLAMNAESVSASMLSERQVVHLRRLLPEP